MQWAVILAGGAGSRFWPLSSPRMPKQLLPLAGPRSTAEDAMRRLDGLIPRERILLVTNATLAGVLGEKLEIPPENRLIEPKAMSTGPALVWATMEAARRDPDAAVLSMHADWSIPDIHAFRATATEALDAAVTHDALITVGMVPSRPETGFGYIIPGDSLGPRAWSVARFTEKPDAAAAHRLIGEGALWNSGLFAWTARRLAAEVNSVTPEIAAALTFLETGDVGGFFTHVQSISIDVGVLERSDRVAVVRGGFAWDDIGTWESLARVRSPDARGNIVVGPAILYNCDKCIVWATDAPIVLSDLRYAVVVQANGRTLVTTRARAPELKVLLDALPAPVRDIP